jgi:hypothetical protein
MWPVNAQNTFKKMDKYMRKEATPPPALPPLLPPNTPRTTQEFRSKWSRIQPKLLDQLSSPSQRQFDSIERGLQTILDIGDITKAERDLLYTRVAEIVRKKPTSRRRVQKGGELTAEYAQQLIQAKDQKEAQKWAKQLARARKKEASKRAKELYTTGVTARQIEKCQKKALKNVAIDDLGAAHLTIPIPDPEVEAKLEQERLEQKAVLGIIPETIPETILEGFEAGDPSQWYPSGRVVEDNPDRQWLQDDYVAFEKDNTSSSDDSDDSDDSFVSAESISIWV